MKYFSKFLMGHKIFSYVLFSQFYFFKLMGLEHKISKLAIKEIYERQNMLQKSHPLSRYKANSGNIKKMFDVFVTNILQ